jgi:hypothetical protein
MALPIWANGLRNLSPSRAFRKFASGDFSINPTFKAETGSGERLVSRSRNTKPKEHPLDRESGAQQ